MQILEGADLIYGQVQNLKLLKFGKEKWVNRFEEIVCEGKLPQIRTVYWSLNRLDFVHREVHYLKVNIASFGQRLNVNLRYGGQDFIFDLKLCLKIWGDRIVKGQIDCGAKWWSRILIIIQIEIV